MAPTKPMLGFPEKFELALRFGQGPIGDHAELSDSDRLLLEALSQPLSTDGQPEAVLARIVAGCTGVAGRKLMVSWYDVLDDEVLAGLAGVG